MLFITKHTLNLTQDYRQKYLKFLKKSMLFIKKHTQHQKYKLTEYKSRNTSD